MANSILDQVGNGLNAVFRLGADTMRSLAREPPPALLPPIPTSEQSFNDDTLVKFVALIDTDPINKEEKVLPVLREVKNRGVNCTIDTVEALTEDRAQVNPLANISVGMDSLLYFYAPPQYGKTTAMLFLTWRAGVDRKMPTVMFTLEKAGESARLRISMNKFNRFIDTCAELLGRDPTTVPKLAMYDSDTRGDDALFGASAGNGLQSEIPIYTLMGSSSGVKKGKLLVENHLSMNVGRDHVGDNEGDWRMKVNVVIDEADVFIQPGKIVNEGGRRILTRGALDTSLRTPVIIKRVTSSVVHPSGRVSHNYHAIEKETFLDAFTSVVLVTATVNAFLTTDRPITTRSTVEVINAEPSSNYWAFMKTPGSKCKLITNVPVDSYAPMLEEMMGDPNPRHALVMIAAREGTSLKKSQRDKALSAATMHPGMVASTWNGDGINVYTSSETWKPLLAMTEAFETEDHPGGGSRLHQQGREQQGGRVER